jgi:uncharacterized protein (DUF1697 family)
LPLDPVRTTFIAFLRAINVGGRTVKMERLRQIFTEMGFTRVRTYIQSGNVFFETAETDREALTMRIEETLGDLLGFEVPSILRTIQELERTVLLNPFAQLTPQEDSRWCILFLSNYVQQLFPLPYVSDKESFEIIAATRGELFAIISVRDGKIGNPTAWIEKKAGVRSTSRFFHTTIKILDAARS